MSQWFLCHSCEADKMFCSVLHLKWTFRREWKCLREREIKGAILHQVQNGFRWWCLLSYTSANPIFATSARWQVQLCLVCLPMTRGSKNEGKMEAWPTALLFCAWLIVVKTICIFDLLKIGQIAGVIANDLRKTAYKVLAAAHVRTHMPTHSHTHILKRFFSPTQKCGLVKCPLNIQHS